MVDFALVPQKTALVNVDMQNCFVVDSPISAPDGLAVLTRINQLAKACRQAGILVIHTAFVLRPDGSNIGVLAETSPHAKAGILNKGRESAALHPGLVVDARDIVLEKPRFGAFHGTDLELILRSRGIALTRSSFLVSPPMSVARPPRARPWSETFMFSS